MDFKIRKIKDDNIKQHLIFVTKTRSKPSKLKVKIIKLKDIKRIKTPSNR